MQTKGEAVSILKSTVLNEALSHQHQGTPYHYTSQAGLLGIIRDKEIWATRARYLNDAHEYDHDVGFLVAELSRRLCFETDPRRVAVLQDMKQGARGSQGICVCSFSEERDSLSQWRSYGGGAGGVAIGFNSQTLADLVRREGFYLAKCIYDTQEQNSIINALIDEMFDRNMKTFDAASGRPSPEGGDLKLHLDRFTPMLKHRSFSTEREWRIISPHLSYSRLDFRPGSSMLTPFYHLPIGHEDLPLKLDRVVVGPTQHYDEVMSAIRSFLLCQGLKDVPIDPSDTPYRNLRTRG